MSNIRTHMNEMINTAWFNLQNDHNFWRASTGKPENAALAWN